MWGQGLPEKGHFKALVYNKPSECLVATFSRMVDETNRVDELYYRHRSSFRYTKISTRRDIASLRHLVSCPNAPVVLFNVWVPGKPPQKGYDWESISSYDLTTGRIERIVAASSLPPIEGYQKAWIASILSANPDSSAVVVTAGLQKLLPDGSFRVDYCVCELNCADLLLNKIADLPDVFA